MPKVGETKPCEYCQNPVPMVIERDLIRKKFCSLSCRQRGRWARGEMREQLVLVQTNARHADKTPNNHKSCDFCKEPYLPYNGRQRWCKVCVPGRIASARLQRYGVSQPMFDAILEQQSGGCRLCGATKRLVIDHDHSCCPGTVTCGNCFRGIICNHCNLKIAVLESDPEWMAAALAYIGGV